MILQRFGSGPARYADLLSSRAATLSTKAFKLALFLSAEFFLWYGFPSCTVPMLWLDTLGCDGRHGVVGFALVAVAVPSGTWARCNGKSGLSVDVSS